MYDTPLSVSLRVIKALAAIPLQLYIRTIDPLPIEQFKRTSSNKSPLTFQILIYAEGTLAYVSYALVVSGPKRTDNEQDTI